MREKAVQINAKSILLNFKDMNASESSISLNIVHLSYTNTVTSQNK